MPNGSKKRFFDLSSNEIAKSLRAVVLREANERKAQNLPIIYKNSMCISRNQFIHEYPDGRKFLIRQNRNTSEEKVIRQF